MYIKIRESVYRRPLFEKFSVVSGFGKTNFIMITVFKIVANYTMSIDTFS